MNNATALDYEAQRAANQAIEAAQVSSLVQTNPNLIPGNGCVNAAKNIRIELKAVFPGVKFSVRSESFSMGNAIRIHWTDGPTVADVEAISNKYEAGSFDGMTDCYNYEHSAFGSAFGTAKYITTSRDLSDDFRAEIIEGVAKKYGDKNKPTVEQWKNGGAYSISPLANDDAGRHWCWQDILYRSSVKSTAGNVVVSDY